MHVSPVIERRPLCRGPGGSSGVGDAEASVSARAGVTLRWESIPWRVGGLAQRLQVMGGGRWGLWREGSGGSIEGPRGEAS